MIKVDTKGWNKPSNIDSFTAKCDKCGSNNVVIHDDIAFGSEWTGQYGSVDMICNDCGNQATIYS